MWVGRVDKGTRVQKWILFFLLAKKTHDNFGAPKHKHKHTNSLGIARETHGRSYYSVATERAQLSCCNSPISGGRARGRSNISGVVQGVSPALSTDAQIMWKWTRTVHKSMKNDWKRWSWKLWSNGGKLASFKTRLICTLLRFSKVSICLGIALFPFCHVHIQWYNRLQKERALVVCAVWAEFWIEPIALPPGRRKMFKKELEDKRRYVEMMGKNEKERGWRR